MSSKGASASPITGESVFERVDQIGSSIWNFLQTVTAVADDMVSDGHMGSPIDIMSNYLRRKHGGKYMVWNLSEATYDYSKFDNQVLEFKFPGYSSPPLDKLFTICNSLYGWLNADPENVVVAHCQSGNGRSIVSIAAYLAYIGMYNSNAQIAVKAVAKSKKQHITRLVCPTHIRYLGYMTAVLSGRRPEVKPVKLTRVILNGIPRAEKNGSCRPYLQVFKDAKLVYTSLGRDNDELRWYSKEDSSVLFVVDQSLEGDILVRVRHISETNERTSLLRFGFHTGFIQPGNLRLMRYELDVACSDNKRFDKEMFMDLIFSPAVDNNGEDLPGSVEASYWDHVMSTHQKRLKDQQERRRKKAARTAGESETKEGATLVDIESILVENTKVPETPTFKFSMFEMEDEEKDDEVAKERQKEEEAAAVKKAVEETEAAKRKIEEELVRKQKENTEAVGKIFSLPIASPAELSGAGLSISSISGQVKNESKNDSAADEFGDLEAYVKGLNSLGPREDDNYENEPDDDVLKRMQAEIGEDLLTERSLAINEDNDGKADDGGRKTRGPADSIGLDGLNDDELLAALAEINAESGDVKLDGNLDNINFEDFT